MDEERRRVVSICEPSGSGKSQLAKAVAERIGLDRCVRIPTDYFLEPSDPDSVLPLRWDWSLLAHGLALPDGTELTTPAFDFEQSRRLSATGGRPFTMRPLVLIDAMAPHPASDLRVLITAPEGIRRERIVARDEIWESRARDRWDRLEATWRSVEASRPEFDLALDGTEPLERNVDRLAALLDSPD